MGIKPVFGGVIKGQTDSDQGGCASKCCGLLTEHACSLKAVQGYPCSGAASVSGRVTSEAPFVLNVGPTWCTIGLK